MASYFHAKIAFQKNKKTKKNPKHTILDTEFMQTQSVLL